MGEIGAEDSEKNERILSLRKDCGQNEEVKGKMSRRGFGCEGLFLVVCVGVH